MKTIFAVLFSLAAPVAAQACDPLGVCSQAVAVQSFAVPQVQQFAVQSHCAPVAVQSFAVQGHAVQVQSVVPFAVQTFAVAPQAVFVQNVGHSAVVVQAQVRHCNGNQGGVIANALGALRPNKGNTTKIKIRQK